MTSQLASTYLHKHMYNKRREYEKVRTDSHQTARVAKWVCRPQCIHAHIHSDKQTRPIIHRRTRFHTCCIYCARGQIHNHTQWSNTTHNLRCTRFCVTYIRVNNLNACNYSRKRASRRHVVEMYSCAWFASIDNPVFKAQVCITHHPPCIFIIQILTKLVCVLYLCMAAENSLCDLCKCTVRG